MASNGPCNVCPPLKMVKSSRGTGNYGLFLINHCYVTQIHLNAKVVNCNVAIFSQTPDGQCNRYKRSCLPRRLLSGIVERSKCLSARVKIGPHEEGDTTREGRTNGNR